MATENSEDSFSKQVSDSLRHYVYRLVDPRDGKTFYVGKGQEGRVFAHEKDAQAEIEALIDIQLEALTEEQAHDPAIRETARKEIARIVGEKNKRLNDIRQAGQKPTYLIHRHGMGPKTAFEVEAALLDIYPELTNLQGGHHSKQRGVASIETVKDIYEPQLMTDPAKNGHKILALNVSRTAAYHPDPYSAARLAWRINVGRAMQADCIFAMVHGVCRGVYWAEKWEEATTANFPDRLENNKDGFHGFTGISAEQKFQELYKDKRLPDHLKRKRGAASQFRYLGAW